MTSDQEQPVADDIVEKLFVDLRGRRYLKWIFSEHGDKCLIERAESGEWVTGISLDVQDEIRAEWRRIAASSIASSEPELRAEIVRLTRERDELRLAIAGKPMLDGLYHGQYLEMAHTLHAACAGGRERAEAAESRVEALSAEVGTARAAAFEEAAQVADMLRGDIGKAIRAHAAIRSRAALDKGAPT